MPCVAPSPFARASFSSLAVPGDDDVGTMGFRDLQSEKRDAACAQHDHSLARVEIARLDEGKRRREPGAR